MKPKCFAFEYQPEKEKEAPIFQWSQTLMNLVEKFPAECDLNVDPYAPLASFHETAMRRALANIKPGIMVEVEVIGSSKTDGVDTSVRTMWVAQVKHMAGYYLFCHWLGAPESDPGFWVHAASASVHPVGHTKKFNTQGYVLCPPRDFLQVRSVDEWSKLLAYELPKQMTLSDAFDTAKETMYKCKFTLGDRLEMIHDEISTCVIPAIVMKTCGRRVMLKISKADVDKAHYYNKEMWRDQADCFLYYVGFAARNKLDIKANAKYNEHAQRIADAIEKGQEPPYTKKDVSREKIAEWKANPNVTTARWKVDMTLEIIDKLDTMLNGLKPARVLQVLKDGYLRLGPEGQDIEEDSFTIHQSSPTLFPVGYADAHGIQLYKPKNDDDFSWKSHMKKNGYQVAPSELFMEYTSSKTPFKTGMKMEAVDQVEKLFCPVTIKGLKGRLVHIGFDGWEHTYDQLYDYRSNELFPIGWVEMHGLPLQNPQQAIESEEEQPKKKKSKK